MNLSGLKPAWSTKQVAGQLGLYHETLLQDDRRCPFLPLTVHLSKSLPFSVNTISM